MSLNIGSRLGHYDVTALIGEGGMGQVYQATDTKLNRQVALKILPEAFAADPDRLARFQREAQVLASLNHPNIAAIHGLEDSEGTKALVLELVEGPTLADRIARGPIPVDEALPIAKQIAEALEAAHEAGVIHRDLKPANIKVRQDGTVKVLDFGLAKALDTTPEGDPSLSPTLTAAATQMGVIMGTAAYMSPEQARGKVVDKRADIWAFGAVLYEILTGQRPFKGRDVSETLAAVMMKEPEWPALPTTLPAPLSRLLRRCLEKEPKDRLRDIGDARVDLRDVYDAPPPTDVPIPVAPVPQPALWRQALPWVGAVLLAIITGIAGWSLRPSQPPGSATRFGINLPPSDDMYVDDPGNSIALSPDGQVLLYVAVRNGIRQIFRRPLNQLEALPLPGTEGGRHPFFDTEGTRFGFEMNGSLRTMAIVGGPPATVNDDAQSVGPSWGANDVIVFGRSSASGDPIMKVAAGGGVAEPVTTLEEGETDHRWPQLLPDGNALLFTAFTGANSHISLKSLKTGERWPLLEGSFPHYVSTGHIVFLRENALWAVPFDVNQLELTGSALPALDGISSRTFGIAYFAVAGNGTLAYLPGGGTTAGGLTLVWVDREGQEEQLPFRADQYRWPRVSPDGSRIALATFDAENIDVWVSELEGATNFSRVTTDPAADLVPLWSPNGERLVFSSDREPDGASSLFWRRADGTGPVAKLLTTEKWTNPIEPYGWSSDGTLMLFVYGDPSNLDIGAFTMEDEGSWEPLLESDANETAPTLSLDGGWIAYASDVTGRSEIYVERFPDLGDRQLISTDGGTDPLWSPDGSELFYRENQRLISVSVSSGLTFTRGTPEVLFEGAYLPGNLGRQYDVSPDGQRFLMFKAGTPGRTPDQPDIIVVENWAEELRRGTTLGSYSVTAKIGEGGMGEVYRARDTKHVVPRNMNR